MIFLSRITFLVLCLNAVSGTTLINITVLNSYNLIIYSQQNQNFLEISKNGILKQQAILGLTSNTTSAKLCSGIDNCIDFKDLRLRVENIHPGGFDIIWSTTNKTKILQDCYNLNQTHVHWFGGPEWFRQLWPIERIAIDNMVNMPQEKEWAAITEGYWLNSLGVYIYMHHDIPGFLDQNVQKLGYVCFAAKDQPPYVSGGKEIMLKYTIGVSQDPRQGHLDAVRRFLGKPKGHPNMQLIENPIWSTWARYYRDINDSLILQFAREIANYGFKGQFEIDDDWETCYGSLVFNSTKFPNMKTTVAKIKEMGFRVSLWIHPFVNVDCKGPSEYGRLKGYFVENSTKSLLTSWWNSGTDQAQYLDFTKEGARDWFNTRLKALMDNEGIDTFKFDAGETSWAPQPPVLQVLPIESPQKITTDFVRNCAQFGDGIEIRTGWGTQDLPVFVRMIDKDSNWGFVNGLYTLITTLLQMNMNGYTMVLPDMVGGNGYNNQKPSAELFVRWLQANTFMPAIQFSFVPWDYLNHTEFNVLEISKKCINLHTKFAGEIKKAMEASITHGHPVNAPIWWIDPENPYAHKVDTQFLLGEDIIVAPVIYEGHTTRDIYLPNGTWIDGNTGTEYQGKQKLTSYPSPITLLPYFLRKGSTAAGVNIKS